MKGAFILNPKITKLLAEKEKNSEKIAKLSARNEEIDSQVTELENLDIVGMVRRVGMTPDQLAALMEAARQSGPLPVLAVGEEEPEHD